MRASQAVVLSGVVCFAVPVGGAGIANGQDGIRGVREQHEAAQRTSQALNRDAREEAREEALRQGTAAAHRHPDLRSADLGLWFASASRQQGLMISDVAEDGAFAEAGFRPNDVVTTINGQPVRTEAQFVQTLLGPTSTPGAATVVVLRDGREQALTVAPTAVMQGVVAADPLHQAGLVLAPNQSDQLVVERVFPRTPAFYAGLRPGDVITSLGGNPVTSVNAFTQALQSSSGADLGLVVTRAGQDRQLALNLAAGAFAADGSVRTAQRTNAAATQTGAFGANQNLQTNQAATFGTDAALPGASGPVGAAGTIANPAVGAITSPSASGNPTSPSLGVQPAGVRTSAPGAATSASGAATSAPGLPTAGTSGVGTVPGSTGGAGAFAPAPSALTPGVNSGATGGVGTVAPGINSGATGAGSTAGGAGAVGGTGALGGAGASAGGAGAVGGTGAIGGAGASATGTGGAAAGGGGTGAGAGGASAGGAGAGGAGGGGAGGGGT